jgi:hypothetical protein
MDLTPANVVFRRALHLPCDLLFGAPPDKEWLTIDHVADLMDRLHDIDSYTHQHPNLASDPMKNRYDQLANCIGYYHITVY